MQDLHQTDEKPAPRDAADEVVATVFCRRYGKPAAVTFKISGGPISVHTDVVKCPLRLQDGCALACLSPTGGNPFS